MTAEHNHPPRCCCAFSNQPGPDDICPACVEHGELAHTEPIRCPQCKTEMGSQHTDTCTLDPGRVWDGMLPYSHVVPRSLGQVAVPLDMVRGPAPADLYATIARDTGTVFAEQRVTPPARCTYPIADHGDGRGCQHDDCPRHGRPQEDTLEGDHDYHHRTDCPDPATCLQHATT